jgi:hypothetical protein
MVLLLVTVGRDLKVDQRSRPVDRLQVITSRVLQDPLPVDLGAIGAGVSLDILGDCGGEVKSPGLVLTHTINRVTAVTYDRPYQIVGIGCTTATPARRRSRSTTVEYAGQRTAKSGTGRRRRNWNVLTGDLDLPQIRELFHYHRLTLIHQNLEVRVHRWGREYLCRVSVVVRYCY